MSFSFLQPPQKLLLGGIIATCCGIFALNSRSAEIEAHRRKIAQRMIESKQARPDQFHVKDGRLVVLPSFEKAHPEFAHSPFFDDTWNREFVEHNLLTSRQNVQQGRWHTVLTSGFMHGSLGHLFFNMFTLANVGPAVMLLTSTSTFVSIWVASGFIGSVTSLFVADIKGKKALQEQPPNVERARRLVNANFVGASASLFGLFAATAVLRPQARWQFMFIPYGIRAPVLLAVTFVGSIVVDALDIVPSIGHWGHVGGMVTGAIMGLIIKNRVPVSRMSMFAALGLTGIGQQRDWLQRIS